MSSPIQQILLSFQVAAVVPSTEIVLAHITTPFTSAYAYASGYGTKRSDPASLPAGSGLGVAFN